MLLINCGLSLTLRWSANCLMMDKVYREAGPNNNPAEINAPTNATFTITDTKLYVPVVILLTEDDTNLLRQLKQYFKKLLNVQIRYV